MHSSCGFSQKPAPSLPHPGQCGGIWVLGPLNNSGPAGLPPKTPQSPLQHFCLCPDLLRDPSPLPGLHPGCIPARLPGQGAASFLRLCRLCVCLLQAETRPLAPTRLALGTWTSTPYPLAPCTRHRRSVGAAVGGGGSQQAVPHSFLRFATTTGLAPSSWRLLQRHSFKRSAAATSNLFCPALSLRPRAGYLHPGLHGWGTRNSPRVPDISGSHEHVGRMLWPQPVWGAE